MSCPLCNSDGGLVVARSEHLRIVQVQDEPAFPAFYRVIWQRHVPEFSDLSASERTICMHAVLAVEQVLRAQLQPTKINLATLGNITPHLHWHVIARFETDTHFPAPIWAAPVRALDEVHVARIQAQCVHINQLLGLETL